MLATLAPDHVRLVASVRKALRTRLPSAHEVAYAYSDAVVISLSPTGRGFEGVFAIRASADGVKLYLNRGKGVPDPEKLLKGSGAQARWFAVPAASALKRPAVAALLDEAIARNTVPFAQGGDGSVSIRPTGASKKRPSKRTK